MLYCVSVTDVNDTYLFPVVLFVHADSYDVGTGNAYDGSVLAAFGRLVVVTFNFRLGALGTEIGLSARCTLYTKILLLKIVHCAIYLYISFVKLLVK